MRTVLPSMTEAIGTLKQRLPHAHDGRKKPRLQRCSLLASGHARTRQAVAPRLGVHRHPIGHGLGLYASGGLDALLALYVPAGQPLSIPPDVLAALEEALRQPAGFASDVERRQWIKRTHHLDVKYHPLDSLVRTRFQTKRKGPRPSHTNKPGGHS